MGDAGSRPSVSDAGIALRLGITVFLFLAAFHHGHFRGTDEVGLLQTSRSLLDAGTLAVPRMVHTGEGRDGRFYSHFSVGQSALAIPFVVLGRAGEALLPEPLVRALAGPDRFLRQLRMGGTLEIFAVGLYAPVVGALLAALFFAFQRELGVSTPAAVLCALLFATTTYVATLSTFFLRHTSETLTIVGAFFCFFRWKQHGRPLDLWLGSALASLTFLVRLPAAVAGPALGAYLAWCLWLRGGRRLDPALLRRALPAVLVPLGVALALSMATDLAKWGAPWNVHQLRTASSLHTPVHVALYGFLLSPGLSVFAYSPLLVLAPLCFRFLWREHRAEAWVCLALGATFLLVFSRFTGWTGLWSAPGPRYQTVSVALFLLPLGLWLDRTRSRLPWLALGVLSLAGLFVQAVLMCVRWGGLIEAMGWRSYQPKWGFLFVAADSPIAGASRLVLRGEELDLWIHTLYHGWPGQPGQPGVALVVALAWCLLWTASLAWLALGIRRASAGGAADGDLSAAPAPRSPTG